MSEKRLYAVEVLFRYYAHAESATEAESWATECASQCNLTACASAAVVPHADHPLETGWERDDFVFHRGPRPVLLGEVLDTLPKRNERRTVAVPLPIDPEADAMFDAIQPSLGTPVAPELRIRRQADVDAAFARGAESMRAAAVAVASKRANLQRFTDSDCAWGRSAECIRDELRHLPVPEDKS